MTPAAGTGRPHVLAWARRGIGPWSALVWLPVFVLVAAVSTGDAPRPGLARAGVALVTLAALAAVLGGALSRATAAQRLAPWALAVQAAATTVLVAAWDGASGLFVLLGLCAATVLPVRLLPYGVAGVGLLAAAATAAPDGTWDALLTVALPAVLAALVVSLLRLLLDTVDRLDRAQRDLARAAVAEERLRFARDLHDLLGHTLSVVVVKAEAVRRLVDRDPAAAKEHAGDVEQIGRDALVELRQAVSGYRGPRLSTELAGARRALDAAGVRLEVADELGEIPEIPESPEDVAGVAAWVVREGVTNVVRHAGATACTITLRETAGALEVTVADDGPGGSAPHDPGAATGLRGLAERVAAVGGTMQAGRAADGYRLTATLPLEPR